MGLVLTAVHGVFALAERGLATDALASVVNEPRPSVSEPME